MRSHDNGTNSITSVSSFQTVDSDNKDVLAGSIMPYRPDTAHGSMTSPTGSTGRQYYSDPDHVTMRLVHSLRASGDYPEQGQLHGDYEEHDEGGTVGWLAWIFCCGCVRDAARSDDDEQAGRTFPE